MSPGAGFRLGCVESVLARDTPVTPGLIRFAAAVFGAFFFFCAKGRGWISINSPTGAASWARAPPGAKQTAVSIRSRLARQARVRRVVIGGFGLSHWPAQQGLTDLRPAGPQTGFAGSALLKDPAPTP